MVGTEVSLIQGLTSQLRGAARNSAVKNKFHSHSHPKDDFFHYGAGTAIPSKGGAP